jgi:hypothetical protein
MGQNNALGKAEKPSKTGTNGLPGGCAGDQETNMRISSFAVMISVAAGSLLALPAFIQGAWAVQDQPMSLGGVESVCTGVGSAKDNPAWSGYPIKLTFSNLAGENEANEHIAITQGGKKVMDTDCDAPWLLIKAPAGRYDVTAMLEGGSTAHASFSTSGAGAQQAINLAFPGTKASKNADPNGQSPAQAAASTQ